MLLYFVQYIENISLVLALVKIPKKIKKKISLVVHSISVVADCATAGRLRSSSEASLINSSRYSFWNLFKDYFKNSFRDSTIFFFKNTWFSSIQGIFWKIFLQNILQNISLESLLCIHWKLLKVYSQKNFFWLFIKPFLPKKKNILEYHDYYGCFNWDPFRSSGSDFPRICLWDFYRSSN